LRRRLADILLGSELAARDYVAMPEETQAERLDVVYLRQWAATLSLEGLLQRALEQASAT
jgi:hypothetical protein